MIQPLFQLIKVTSHLLAVTFLEIKGRKRNGNSHMTSVLRDKRQTIYHQSKQRSRSGAEKNSSRVHPTSDKVQRLISCVSTNIAI